MDNNRREARIMKHLFLTSQITSVVDDIAQKLGSQVKQPCVYITTSFKYTAKVHDWQLKHRASLVAAGFNLTDYDLTGKSEQELAMDLASYPIMYVEGGNVAYLLQQSQRNNFGAYVKQRVEEGVVYIASSAGSVIVGPDISANGRPGKMPADYGVTDPSGFNLVNFVILPHWGAPDKKEAYLQHKIPSSYREDHPYILLSNHQYVEVKDNLYQIIDTIKV